MIAHYVFRVMSPTLAPLPARVGQLLVVAPGDPDGNVSILTPDAARVLRRGDVPDGVLYGLILGLDADGVLECLTPSQWQAGRLYA